MDQNRLNFDLYEIDHDEYGKATAKHCKMQTHFIYIYIYIYSISDFHTKANLYIYLYIDALF